MQKHYLKKKMNKQQSLAKLGFKGISDAVNKVYDDFILAKTIHKTSAATRTVNSCFEKAADDTIFINQLWLGKLE